jgi:flagellin-like protein
MNVLGEKARSWRKAQKRGVSPIIATILLVAITVVLAAVLYVLISGLTHGPSSAPLGTNFSWGQPINATGTTPTGCTAATGHYCYTIEIAGSSVTTSNIVLSLRNSVGSTVAWPGTPTISLISPTVSTAVATYSTSTSGWTLAGGFSGTISGGFSLVIYTSGVGAGAGLYGDQVVAIGASGYSGSVPSSSFQ